MNTGIEKFDEKVLVFLKKYADEMGRCALFLIFFWFGILKVFLLSPAGPLVTTLLETTFLNFLDPNDFQIGFGIFEMLLGVLVLFPKLERISFAVMGIHLFTTIMPLFMLPEITWSQAFVPTLTGQYIIKNAALLALGLLLLARMKPMSVSHHFLAEEDDILKQN